MSAQRDLDRYAESIGARKRSNVSNTSASSGGGIGFAGLLTIAFIVLKLTGYITWSWLWVLSPLWISFALSIVIIVVLLLIALIVSAFD